MMIVMIVILSSQHLFPSHYIDTTESMSPVQSAMKYPGRTCGVDTQCTLLIVLPLFLLWRDY